MNFEQVMHELEEMGSEQTRKTYKRHGFKEPMYGVKIGDLKKLAKKIKKDHELGLELYRTGNYDAKYLAQYIVEPKKMSKEILDEWVNAADGYSLSEYAVSAVAAESPFALECIRDWIKCTGDNSEAVKAAGYSTYSYYISMIPNEQLDLDEISSLIKEIGTKIHSEQNRVRYTMNGFVISVGTYIPELLDQAIATAEAIGKVSVDMGDTSCKVPLAKEYIQKVHASDKGGKKRKSVIGR